MQKYLVNTPTNLWRAEMVRRKFIVGLEGLKDAWSGEHVRW
jgi:hypothetical protein